MDGTPQYSELNDEERAWIAEQVSRAEVLGARPEDPASIAVVFDGALAATVAGVQPPEAENEIVNLVGVLLGEHLRAACDLEWRIVEDETGTDLCLVRPGTTWTLLPQATVAERWESREAGWLEAYCAWARDAAGS